MKSSSSNAVRNANKKLRNYEQKNPGVRNERYKELLKGLIKAQVAVAKAEQREAKKKASQKIKNLTDEEALDAAFKQNAPKNAIKNAENDENKRLEKVRLEESKKQDELDKEKYKVRQSEIAKHIIMSIVESAELNQ
jgi:hypothetical protein